MMADATSDLTATAGVFFADCRTNQSAGGLLGKSRLAERMATFRAEGQKWAAQDRERRRSDRPG
jgi:hypothetical protein